MGQSWWGSAARAGFWVAMAVCACDGDRATQSPESKTQLREHGDLDRDGIPDPHDACPEQPGVKPGGCPDGGAPVIANATGDSHAAGQCVHRGTTYENGATVRVRCGNTCQCVDGTLRICTLLACETTLADRVYFARGVASTPNSERGLQEIVDTIKGARTAQDPFRISIVGHASTGEAKDLEALSLERARRVHALLMERGVQPDVFASVTGVADREPLSPDSDAENQFVHFDLVYDEPL